MAKTRSTNKTRVTDKSSWEKLTKLIGDDGEIHLRVDVGMKLSLNYDTADVRMSLAATKPAAKADEVLTAATAALRDLVGAEVKATLQKAKTAKRQTYEEGLDMA